MEMHIFITVTKYVLMVCSMVGIKRRVGFKYWLKHTAITVLIGVVGGYVLSWVWYLFALLLLGYGDSGPSWMNNVNDLSILLVFFVVVAIGQILFIKKKLME